MSNIKDIDKRLGLLVRQRRRELDMSQEELALKMGFKGRTSISKLEDGAHGLPLSKVELLAQCLECSTAYLIGIDREERSIRNLNEQMASQDVELVSKYAMLEHEYQLLVMNIIDSLLKIQK